MAEIYASWVDLAMIILSNMFLSCYGEKYRRDSGKSNLSQIRLNPIDAAAARRCRFEEQARSTKAPPVLSGAPRDSGLKMASSRVDCGKRNKSRWFRIRPGLRHRLIRHRSYGFGQATKSASGGARAGPLTVSTQTIPEHLFRAGKGQSAHLWRLSRTVWAAIQMFTAWFDFLMLSIITRQQPSK
jgi:hypothetical protein